MASSLATVSSLCTAAETALVRASRKPAIDRLAPAEIKRLAERARKQLKKWDQLARGQSRQSARATGAGGIPQNTERKAEFFREALARFDAKLAAAADAGGARKKAKAAPPTKKKRQAEHRATRAAVRKGMAVAEHVEKRHRKQSG